MSLRGSERESSEKRELVRESSEKIELVRESWRGVGVSASKTINQRIVIQASKQTQKHKRYKEPKQ